jgi:hypothetical protein
MNAFFWTHCLLMCRSRNIWSAVASPQRTLATLERLVKSTLTVHCLGPDCHHQAVTTFEELKFWNDMIFVDVPKYRRFVCTQCGSRNVKVMPIFPRARGTPGYRNQLR